MAVNSIIDGIVLRLDSVFGDNSTIYTESIEQDFDEPCFYIKMLSSSQTLYFNNRYLLKYSFDVHYFPGSSNRNAEMYDIAEKLYNLEYIISVDNLIRGTKLSYEIIDEVLHFYVQYNYFAILTKEEEDKMQTVKVNSEIGG